MNFSGLTFLSRCEGVPAFREPTPSPSVGCIGGLVAPKPISFGATKPPALSEDGDGVGTRNVGKPSHLDAAVCQRKFH